MLPKHAAQPPKGFGKPTNLPPKPVISKKPTLAPNIEITPTHNSPKQMSHLYRKDENKNPPPRIAQSAFPGTVADELGAALERRRLKSVGVEQSKMFVEEDKPKFASILKK